MVLFWKYFVDIRSEAWLNLFWEYINGKSFAVHAEKPDMVMLLDMSQNGTHVDRPRFKVAHFEGLDWSRTGLVEE